jgi:hypothetical protein
MSTATQLIFVHTVLALCVAFCLSNIFGRMGHWTYEARMAVFLRHFLMPGKLAERDAWVRQQKLISWIGLVVAGVCYVTVMVKILS